MKNIINLFLVICAYKIGKVIFWYLVATWYVYFYILFYVCAFYTGWMLVKNWRHWILRMDRFKHSWGRSYHSIISDIDVILTFYFLLNLISERSEIKVPKNSKKILEIFENLKVDFFLSKSIKSVVFRFFIGLPLFVFSIFWLLGFFLYDSYLFFLSYIVKNWKVFYDTYKWLSYDAANLYWVFTIRFLFLYQRLYRARRWRRKWRHFIFRWLTPMGYLTWLLFFFILFIDLCFFFGLIFLKMFNMRLENRPYRYDVVKVYIGKITYGFRHFFNPFFFFEW